MVTSEHLIQLVMTLEQLTSVLWEKGMRQILSDLFAEQY